MPKQDRLALLERSRRTSRLPRGNRFVALIRLLPPSCAIIEVLAGRKKPSRQGHVMQLESVEECLHMASIKMYLQTAKRIVEEQGDAGPFGFIGHNLTLAMHEVDQLILQLAPETLAEVLARFQALEGNSANSSDADGSKPLQDA
jgi:hypothetical protein